MKTTEDKKQRPRIANHLTKPVGSHYTLTRVLEGAKGRYGFCISDEGKDGFIPNYVIERYDITPEDEGAGFYAPVREAHDNGGNQAAPQVMPPVLFDEDINEG